MKFRNIPAHAGKTRIARDSNEVRQEHPRTRGENGFVTIFVTSIEGTSPHTRGKLDSLKVSSASSRNIPAHAGKTLILMSKHFWNREHPRTRGEN